MRIAVLTPTFLPVVGGAELLLLHVFRRLARRHDVLLVTPRLPRATLAANGSTHYDAMVNFAVRRYDDRFSFVRIPGHRATRGLIPPFSLSAAAAVRAAARDFAPDVLNVHYCMPTGLAAVYAERVLGIPTVLSLVGRDVPGPGVPPLWTYWHRLVGRAVSGCTYVTDFCRRAVYGAGDHREGRVIVNGVDAPPPVPEADVRALRRRLGVPEGGHLLFALQRVDPLKRVDVLVRAMPSILRRYPDTVLCVGGTGADLGRVRAVAAELGVEGAVRFAGFVPDEDIPVHMAACDLFVFHSTYETFGIVLAEAMAGGRAVVSVEDGAIREVVDHGETGLLVPILDHEAMAEAVSGLLGDPDRRAAMGRAGRYKARRLYDWDVIAEQYERAFADACGRRV